VANQENPARNGVEYADFRKKSKGYQDIVGIKGD
jgi:hypothetical protein